jgi:hypothetical protein
VSGTSLLGDHHDHSAQLCRLVYVVTTRSAAQRSSLEKFKDPLPFWLKRLLNVWGQGQIYLPLASPKAYYYIVELQLDMARLTSYPVVAL